MLPKISPPNTTFLYKAGTDGTGQTIGIIGTSNINLALVAAYRKLFNLPADHTQVIVDGTDPGDPLEPNVEAFLDVEVSGAVAPNATVNFYVAGGQPFQDSLALAALRAIEDNQASVMSLSYGECEQLLGNAGNQLWAGLWQQTAAQGQTVMVSSGDTGPTTCLLPTISNGFPTATSGLSVNGIGSTPWNVSVGGTDFYYSDYASGAPSAATLWNQTNDASQGSLRAPLPEQPWDNAFGSNAIPFSFTSFIVPSDAGGGGASNCSQESAAASPELSACISGYAKPSWQNAPGVPNDGARDLPDISLFASDGSNLSGWAICVFPWECTAGDSNPRVLLVGGTSTSSPAMAGIMALVNQKYGRQGQADFTLYALARQSELSVSAAVPLTVTPTDFTLASSASNLSVKSGQTLSVPLNLGGPYGVSVPVALSCAPSMASIGCTVNPGSATVSGSGSATLTINAFTPGTAASAREPVRSGVSTMGAGGFVIALAIGWVLPFRRRRYWMTAMVAVTVTGAMMIAGCGGSKSSPSPTPAPTPQSVNAPGGSYSVVITGASGGITHNVRVNFSVQ